MNELLKYKNEMNTVKFNGFNAVDYNLFMALCARMKEKGTQEITFDFATLRKIVNYPKAKTDKQFVADLRHLNREMMKLTCSFVVGQKEIDFVLFPTFERDLENKKLTVAVNPKFAFLINDFTNAKYTAMELKRFIGIKGKYAKTIYRYLRQFRSTGLWSVSIGDFRELLCIPPSYKIKEIKKFIIDPAIDELQKFFPELTCEPFYQRKQGAPIGGYMFKFIGDDEVPGQTSLDDYAYQKKPRKKKKFEANFHQRENDYNELEKILINKGLPDDWNEEEADERLNEFLNKKRDLKRPDA